MNYQVLFSAKNKEKIFKKVVCLFVIGTLRDKLPIYEQSVFVTETSQKNFVKYCASTQSQIIIQKKCDTESAKENMIFNLSYINFGKRILAAVLHEQRLLIKVTWTN